MTNTEGAAMTIKALIFSGLGEASLEDIEPTLEPLQNIIGGWLEAITVGEWHAYIDEEGKLKDLPPNFQATRLAHECGWRVRDVLQGPVIFLGTDYEEGDELPVPQSVIDRAVALGLLVLPG